MEPSLFSFIWKYSRREQLVLLAFTLFTFPFLYVTLELPKRIINDAIGAKDAVIDLFGTEVTQVQFLFVLCFAYLAAVLVHGVLKMRLNTMKGVLSERLLRRFRYQLIDRMMRFPRSYFQTTSQGELVSMVTSEAEPMGGLMGDFVAQPVFQAGQMLVIVAFLFVQSPWFGLAGVALIPLQAWLIPVLQRQINQLNKARVIEVRALSAEIGETAAGIADLRTNGGWRYRLAQFTDRLGRLFDIRFQIYQKKFFMKFLNNFITQLTPFFFYAVGGYLAIKGQITVGALVAALAAYKDLSSPWKELLDYYNQTQDMGLRWDVVTERFAPKGMVDEALFAGVPESIPRLDGDVEMINVSVRNADGNMLLEDISLHIPQGARVAIEVPVQSERTALAEVLTREVMPARGRIEIAGRDLATLHQAVLAARIGYAAAQPYLFQGSLGDNLLMSLRTGPTLEPKGSKTRFSRNLLEAYRTGNSREDPTADWLNPALADFTEATEVGDWWFRLTEAMGNAEMVFRNMLTMQVDPERHPDLTKQLVALRDEVHDKLVARRLNKVVYRFDPDRFNPAVPLGSNLMFASPIRSISQQGLAAQRAFLGMVTEQGLAEQGIAISQTLVETLHQTFGMDGTGHPLFTALGIEEELYEQLVDIASRRRDKGDGALTQEEFALLLTVPFAFTAEQFGPAFPDSFKEEILRIRQTSGASLRARVSDMFVPIAPTTYLPRLTILENLLYGRVSSMAGVQSDLVIDAVSEVLEAHGLQQMISALVFDLPTVIGGTNLPTLVQERAALGRAALKRPDVLICNQLSSGQNAEAQAKLRDRLSDLLPKTTQIYLRDRFEKPEEFDMHVVVRGGRIDGLHEAEDPVEDEAASTDLRRKLRILARNPLFGGLDPRSQRLLAFSAQWYRAEPGQRVFSIGDRPDAVYLCLSGLAELSWNDLDGMPHHVSDVEPGRMIGDLAIILDEPRQLDLTALEDVQFLRIGAEEFRAVMESDRTMLLSLLHTVAGHLTSVADLLREAKIALPREVSVRNRAHSAPERRQ
ncbi:ABC transporter transmembrane domain-containing protein [Sulfitobacter brevis]|nr:ABC transporter transmembrane domain-containing protein [Sulfitobacter brevis]